ncbi:MAG: hypothetical protein RLW62_05440 [Gammaproteobacteria bacterium]
MRLFDTLLILFTVVIFAVSIAAAASHGFNWPATFFADLLVLDWRSQFDADLLLHLVLLGVWVSWREGGTARGHLFGVLCVVWGGMFTFPYLLWAGVAAGGDPLALALGVHARSADDRAEPRPQDTAQ